MKQSLEELLEYSQYMVKGLEKHIINSPVRKSASFQRLLYS